MTHVCFGGRFARLLSVTAVSALLALVLADLVSDFRENQALSYYLQRPAVLVLIVLVACSIALVAAVLRQRSRRWEQRFVTVLWASTNVLLTCLGGFFAFGAIRYAAILRSSAVSRLVAHNAESENLPTVWGCVAVVVLLGTLVSWLFLVRQIRAQRGEAVPADKPDI